MPKLSEKAKDVVSLDSFLNPELMEKLNTSLNKVSLTTAETDEAIQKMADELTSKTVPAVKDTSDAVHDMTNDIAESSSAFTTDFVTGLMEGKNALSSFGDFAKDIVKQIIATFIRLTLVNKILNAVFGGFGGFTALPTADASRFNPFAKAGGGAVQTGRPTLVGERGAEIFVPNSSGRIMNNADSKSAMGGGSGVTVNQSINFSTGVVPTVRAEVMRMMPQISDSTKAAVIEASQRGGRFRKALAGA